MKTTFIYALCEPGAGTVRYIGKTARPKQRLTEHLRDSIKTKTHLGNWLRSLGMRPEMEILDEVTDSQGAFWEREYIRVFRALGLTLVNGTDGGDGVTMTPEIRGKISATLTGRKRPPEECAAVSAGMKRITKTPEHCAALRRAVKSGVNHYSFGVPRSIEARKKTSDTLTGRKRTPEECAAISAGRIAANRLRKERDLEIEWALAPYTLE